VIIDDQYAHAMVSREDFRGELHLPI
jgi:hypothetical protein